MHGQIRMIAMFERKMLGENNPASVDEQQTACRKENERNSFGCRQMRPEQRPTQCT